MKTTPGTAGPDQIFREMSPGQTFRTRWKGKDGEYLTSDLGRADPQSNQPWDFRAAINMETGEAVFLGATHLVSPTRMKAVPV
jgi:hypothetical protein